MREPASVARRCLILELLAQRAVLEVDAEVPVADRERARAAWCGREKDLGIAELVSAEERALLDAPVGSLSEDQLDDADGRGLGAAVLLWALGRSSTRPNVKDAEAIVAEHGLLGDGSVAKARAAAEGAKLRSEDELDDALAAYVKVRGKAKEVEDPERVFAGVAAHHLTWVLDEDLGFDEDIEL